ncbi:lytic transglycosylase domain-containing protein [Dokdonella immobilis]|uniref:lytic transglycosylase domain-containing protein n=1 Tax=Dokdonella immobilis TaxID=578942 RepID=UPI001FE49A36|nr:lytic transglycosylase domain-containing protein [Dokdonella immobilis]
MFGLLAALLMLVATNAAADTLYKCEGPGGSVAYTNKSASFTACKAIGRYQAGKPAPTSAQARRKVDYQERPDVRAASSGVASTAAIAPAPARVPRIEPPANGPAPADNKVMTSATTASLAPRVLRGAVYRVERSSGVTEYTNVRPRDGRFAVLFTYISTCVACDLHSTINFARTALNLDAYRDEVAVAAAESGVDESLLRAVIHAESAFNPMALSSKGAQGLMQLMPGTATDLGVDDAFDAAQNIRGGAQYLARMLKNFNGDERLATAAYNAGPAAVQKYADVPPYAETQVYVERVATLRDRYRKAL